MRHLLVTNDYPPKVGGIQVYLWEIYRRMPQHEITVLTRPHPGDAEFDAAQQHRIIRSRQPFLLPEPWLARQIDDIVTRNDIDLVMYDPAVPVGALGPRLDHRYGVVLHGAEVTIPGRVPGTRQLLGQVLRNAALVVTAGAYSTAEAERAAGCTLPVAVVPPGVDTDRYRPLEPAARQRARRDHGLTPDTELIVAISRLVPRKGIDKVIDAVAMLAPRRPRLRLLVGGTGRDRARLERRARRLGAPVRFLERIPDAELPQVYGMADLFTMPCRVRWGGLEQEGFGIVFVEAAACGVPQVAGRSGGAAEAVLHGITGLVVDTPRDARALADALEGLLDDDDRRAAMGVAGRERAVAEFDYDKLASRFHEALVRAAS